MHKKKNKLPLFSWLIAPIIMVWIGSNYILGTLQKPIWQKNSSSEVAQEVLGAAYELDSIPSKQWKWNNQGLVTLWFDDAWLSQYTNAYPKLAAHKFSAALAVPTLSVGLEAYMNWSQIKRLQFQGWEITAHSRSHNCDLVDLPQADINSEIVGSKNDLILHGVEPDIYVSPCGKTSDQASEVISQNFVAARNVDPGYNSLPLAQFYDLKVQEINSKTTPEEVKQWLQTAKQTKSWLILMFHQIEQDATDLAITPDMLEHLLDVINEVDIEVVVPSQVINYVR